jgi:branched-chain amino acid transport system substrate-binding protein
VLLLTGCGGGGEDEPTGRTQVTLGVVQSLTGAADVYGKTIVEGIQLAAEEINQSQSSGLHIDVTVLDDASTVEGARGAFSALVGQEVTAIIGPTLSNGAPEAHRLSQAAGIPTLGATTTAAGITDTGDYVFRVALPEAVVVPAVIEYVAKKMPVRETILIFESADAFSRSSADAMRAGLAAAGASSPLEIDITQTPDVGALLASLRLLRPVDAILVTPLIDKSAEIVKALRGAGFTQQIIGGNSFNTQSIVQKSAGGVEGAYVGAAWNPGVTTAASRRFVDAYKRAYSGREPDLFAAQGYASVQILADAVQRAGPADRAALRDALASTDRLETALGVLTMSPRREALHAPVVQQYRGGVLTAVQ